MPDNYTYMHVTLHCLYTLCHVLKCLFGGTVIYLLIQNSKTNFKKGYRDIVPTVRFKPCLKMDMPSHSVNLNVQKMCSKLERSQIASFNVAPALWHHDFSSPRPLFTWIILNLCPWICVSPIHASTTKNIPPLSICRCILCCKYVGLVAAQVLFAKLYK